LNGPDPAALETYINAEPGGAAARGEVTGARQTGNFQRYR